MLVVRGLVAQSLCIERSFSCAPANSVRVRVEEVMLRWRMRDDGAWESWVVVILCVGMSVVWVDVWICRCARRRRVFDDVAALLRETRRPAIIAALIAKSQ